MSKPKILAHGFYWQDLEVGQEFLTFGRTITEADLIGFITVTGMTEMLFTNTLHKGAIEGRIVPAALSYTIIEGLLVQGMIQGTGLALLEVHKKLLSPVRVGDTIHGHVLVTEIKPTSKPGRAVVTCEVTVLKQDDTAAMTYTVKRLMAGDPAKTGEAAA